MYHLIALGLFTLAQTPDAFQAARSNADRSQKAIRLCNRHAYGWLDHVDDQSGLLPRTLRGENYWNAKDCAADNYPFIVLTAWLTDDYYLKRNVRTMLDVEQKLTNRVDSLPDDYDFEKQGFRTDEYAMDHLIFGASEYAKDGLMPITEWMGPGPWLDRMRGLVDDIFKHAAHDSPAGKLPSTNVEVNGELLQVTSRLYWLTDDDRYKTWALRIADHYFLHHNLLERESLRLRDHGCEIVAGLSEACVIAAHRDPARWERYRPAMRRILDRILEAGINEDGMMYGAFNPRTGERQGDGLSDTWGYVYNAFLTMAELDEAPEYRDAVAHVLSNAHKYHGKDVKGLGGADGYADAIEGAINLLNRLPVPSAFDWVDAEIEYIFEHQRPDGIIEGWYGDGNSARTAMMYALWKTQGVSASPWREDVKLGASLADEGDLRIFLQADWAWNGKLRFDRRRAREVFHMPVDYPRINQFPEWFTVEDQKRYEVTIEGSEPRALSGRDLAEHPITLEPGTACLLTVRRLPG